MDIKTYRQLLLKELKEKRSLRKIKKNVEHQLVEDQTLQSWNRISPKNAQLRIVKNGHTAFYDEEVEKNKKRIVQLSLFHEVEKYNELNYSGIFRGSLTNMSDYTLFHEVGHSYDKKLIQLRSEKRDIVRISRGYWKQENKEMFILYFNQSHDFTLLMENFGWDYGMNFLTSEHNLKDYFDLKLYCLNSYNDFHKKKLNFFLSAFQ